MFKSKLLSLKSHRPEIHKKIKTLLPKLPEKDNLTLQRLLERESYKKSDIVKCSEEIFKNYSADFTKQFKILTKMKEFDKLFQQIRNVQHPVFVIYRKKDGCWILLVVFTIEERLFYKDPCGDGIQNLILEKFEATNPEFDVEVKENKSQESNNKMDSGALTLRNLDIVLKEMERDYENFFQNFSNLTFFKRHELEENRVIWIARLAEKLSTNEDVQKYLKKGLRNFPFDQSLLIDKFFKMLTEENNALKLQQAGDFYLSGERLEPFNELFEDLYLKLDKNLPEGIEDLHFLFKQVFGIQNKKDLLEVIQKVCNFLKVDYGKIRRFYDGKPEEEPIVKKKINKVRAIADDLPTPKVHKVEENLDELLQEANRQNLKDKFDKIEQYYETWKDYTIFDISSWVKKNKKSDFDLCELISVLDRAYQLLTTWKLRKCQILALLMFLEEGKNKGVLNEIKPNEGKSLIVVFLTIIKVMQGHIVDIVSEDCSFVEVHQKFFDLFDVEVGINKEGLKVNFEGDVLCGKLNTFQMDHLTRNEDQRRKSDIIILDGIDSIVNLTDNVVKLGLPFAGLDYLNYVFFNIWLALPQVEAEYVEKMGKKLDAILNMKDKEQAEMDLKEFIKTTKENEVSLLAKIMKDPANVPSIPPHLKEQTTKKLTCWIKSALIAKYQMQENIHYKIVKVKDEEIISPIVWKQASVKSKNIAWKTGVEQFLQLKHNLRITFVKIPADFISSITYLKKYKSILGVAGSLGSLGEREFLSNLYGVDTFQIPAFRKTNLQELPMKNINDETWPLDISCIAREKIDAGKSVVIVFDSKNDLAKVEKNLKILQKNKFDLKACTDVESIKKLSEIKSREIILITCDVINFLKLDSKKVNLYICVAFLPCNVRVEEEIFGRFEQGTAQIIFKETEFQKLEYVKKGFKPFAIKVERNVLEMKKLNRFTKTGLKKLIFWEDLLKHFKSYISTIEANRVGDITEFWSFWLDSLKYNKKSISEKEFQKFESEAKQLQDSGKYFNILNSIELLESLIDNDTNGESLKFIKQLQDGYLSAELDYLPGLQLKFFEAWIRQDLSLATELTKKLQEANPEIFVKINPKTDLSSKIVLCIERILFSLLAEMQFIIRTYLKDNKHLEVILTCPLEKNYLILDMFLRYQCLYVHQNNILMLQRLFRLKGTILQSKERTSIYKFNKIQKVTEEHIRFLHLIGLDNYYAAVQPNQLTEEMINDAQLGICTALNLAKAASLVPMLIPDVVPRANCLMAFTIIHAITRTYGQKYDHRLKRTIGHILMHDGHEPKKFETFLKNLIGTIPKYNEIMVDNEDVLEGCVHKCKTVIKESEVFINKMLEEQKLENLNFQEKLEKLEELQKDENEELFEKLGGEEKLQAMKEVQERKYRLVNLQNPTPSEEKKSLLFMKVINPRFNRVIVKLIEGLETKIEEKLETVSDNLRTSPEYHNLLLECVKVFTCILKGNIEEVIVDGVERALQKNPIIDLLVFLNSEKGEDTDVPGRIAEDVAKVYFPRQRAKLLAGEEFEKFFDGSFKFEEYFREAKDRNGLMERYWKALIIYNEEGLYEEKMTEKIVTGFGKVVVEDEL